MYVLDMVVVELPMNRWWWRVLAAFVLKRCRWRRCVALHPIGDSIISYHTGIYNIYLCMIYNIGVWNIGIMAACTCTPYRRWWRRIVASVVSSRLDASWRQSPTPELMGVSKFKLDISYMNSIKIYEAYELEVVVASPRPNSAHGIRTTYSQNRHLWAYICIFWY